MHQLTIIPPAAPPALPPPIDIDWQPRRSIVESVTHIAAGVVSAVRADKRTIAALEAQVETLRRRNAALAQELSDLKTATTRQRWSAAQREALAGLLADKRRRKLTYAKMAALLQEDFGRPFNARQVGDAARRLIRKS
jgi:hypothetical protein